MDSTTKTSKKIITKSALNQLEKMAQEITSYTFIYNTDMPTKIEKIEKYLFALKKIKE